MLGSISALFTRLIDTRQSLRPDPVCPVCRGPVHRGDHVVFGQDDLTHLQCHLGVRDLGDVVERYLRGHAGGAVCHSCLSAALDITFAEARKATARLPVSREFVTGPGECSNCSAVRMIVRAVDLDS